MLRLKMTVNFRSDLKEANSFIRYGEPPPHCEYWLEEQRGKCQTEY